MKIYTRTGDEGTTAVFGGDRVRKDHPRIVAYGTVDEANSQVGLARAHLHGTSGYERLDSVLAALQEDLFVLGADLATPADAKPVVPRVDADHVSRLEDLIDTYQDELPPLKHFILPGGTPGGATLHLARTTCRRAERMVIRAADDVDLNEQVAVYLNRLSDLLFVLARWANRKAGSPEDTWAASS